MQTSVVAPFITPKRRKYKALIILPLLNIPPAVPKNPKQAPIEVISIAKSPLEHNQTFRNVIDALTA